MAKDAKIDLGQDILSYCGRCKMPLTHLIITLTKKGLPDKCECKTCKAKHKYRDPDKVSKTGTRIKKATLSAEAVWKEVMEAAKGPAIAYAMSGEFEEGQLLDHTSFGQGVVKELVGCNKIRVIFEAGEKLLIQKHQID